MRKEERHQIKRDELVTVLERATAYLEVNILRVSLIAGAVVVLTLGGFGLRAWLGAREEKASSLIGQIMQTYRSPVALSLEALQQAPPGSRAFGSVDERSRKVIEMADELLSHYGMSRSAPKALYYKALALNDMNKPDEAAKSLKEVLERHPEDFLAPMARYQLARILEARGNPSEALIQFQALVEDSRALFPREEGLLGVARCQETLGRKEEALKTYRKIVSDFPESDYQFEARKKVDELS
jgi:TolA-binding protein